MSNLANLPRKIGVRINSDEELVVHVLGMRMLNDKLLQISGFIDHEDSQIIKRGNAPGIIFCGCRLFVVEYHEYEHDKDAMCIECQITFSETNPSAK